MIDPRPVGYVIGQLVLVLGLTMLIPMALDFYLGNPHWQAFFQSAVMTAFAGLLVVLACANGVERQLTIQQTFLLTTLVWVALPVFGALPFVLGATEALQSTLREKPIDVAN